MSVKERLSMQDILARITGGEPPASPPPIVDQRAWYDGMFTGFGEIEGYNEVEERIGGINSLLVRGANVTRHDAALLYFHGGGYALGSFASHRQLAGLLSIESGLPVYLVEYRLAPENPYPAAIDDGLAAYRGLLDAGFAPQSIAVGGDSGGAGLAIGTLFAARNEGLPLPACVLALSPWVDLSQGGESIRSRAAREPLLNKDALDGLASIYLNGTSSRNPLASPIFGTYEDFPPLLVQVGSEEMLYSDAATLAAKAEQAGVKVLFEEWDGMVHVWHLFCPVLAEAKNALARAGEFVKTYIK